MVAEEGREGGYVLRPIGRVCSSVLRHREDCPHQGIEGAPEAWIEIDPGLSDGLDGIGAGSEILLFTWLHQAQRGVLKLHPRGDPRKPLRGVFATRSPDRPNPVGLHRVKVLETAGPGRLRVGPLEVIDGTPVIDIKPVLSFSRDE